MKKQVILFSSLLLVGMIGLSQPAEATEAKVEAITVRTSRAATSFYVDSVRYTTIDGNTNEVMADNHYFNALPETLTIPSQVEDRSYN